MLVQCNLTVLQVLLLFSTSWKLGNAKSCKVEWVKPFAVGNISELEPGGTWLDDSEKRGYLFVARGAHISEDTFIPGKVHAYLDQSMPDHVDVAFNGTEIYPNNLEFLRYPPGAVSWIPGTGVATITPNHIFGGIDPTHMAEVYVCRAMHEYEEESNLTVVEMNPILGKFLPSRGICSVPYGGLGHDYDEYEILKLNWYGTAIEAGNGREPPEETTCEAPTEINSIFDGKVRWVDPDKVANVTEDLEPAGFELDPFEEGERRATLYVARAQYIFPETYVPGKYHVYPDRDPSDHADFSYNGTELKEKNYQLLTFPRGSVSWVTREGIQEITPYHIFGGVDPQDLEEVYICRAWHSYNYNGSDYLNLLPGKYVPSKGVCSVPFAEVGVDYGEYEILVLNWHGVALGAGNGR